MSSGPAASRDRPRLNPQLRARILHPPAYFSFRSPSFPSPTVVAPWAGACGAAATFAAATSAGVLHRLHRLRAHLARQFLQRGGLAVAVAVEMEAAIFSATIRLISVPSRPWPACPWPPSPPLPLPPPPAMNTRSGTSGCWLLRQVLGDQRQGVQPRVAERLPILRSSTDASDRPICSDPLALAAAGQDPLLALGLGGDDRLLGLPAATAPARPRPSTIICSACLRAAGQVGLALVLGDLHLHLRVGQLRLHRRPCAWASFSVCSFSAAARCRS